MKVKDALMGSWSGDDYGSDAYRAAQFAAWEAKELKKAQDAQPRTPQSFTWKKMPDEHQNDKKHIVGMAGQDIAKAYYESQGFDVKFSDDPYDQFKDMTITSYDENNNEKTETVEVKTCVPFITKSAMSFKQNQFKKCISVDRLIFIAVPTKDQLSKNYVNRYAGCVYEIINPKKNMKHYDHQTKDGRKMVLVPIEQDAVKLVNIITDNDVLEKMMKNSSSNLNNPSLWKKVESEPKVKKKKSYSQEYDTDDDEYNAKYAPGYMKALAIEEAFRAEEEEKRKLLSDVLDELDKMNYSDIDDEPTKNSKAKREPQSVEIDSSGWGAPTKKGKNLLQKIFG